VGITAARALESLAATGEASGRTSLFITRGHEWRTVDLLLTNFHMPRTSLLLMIDSFVGPRWRRLYAEAVAERYRFLSFGDAMLLDRTLAGD
jgi:S-adenosylmethionine:tRNA ribosyltransferase-isomerase